MFEYDQIYQVHDVKTFLEFLNNLAKDSEENPEEWQNQSASQYLESIAGWIEDYCDKNGTKEFDNLDFVEMAKILYMGKIYE